MLKIKYLISMTIPLTVLLGSCGGSSELAQVRELQTLADQAQEKLPKVANDIHHSCLRAARYKAPVVLPRDPANMTGETSQSQDKNELIKEIDELIKQMSSSLPPTQQLINLKNKGSSDLILPINLRSLKIQPNKKEK